MDISKFGSNNDKIKYKWSFINKKMEWFYLWLVIDGQNHFSHSNSFESFNLVTNYLAHG